MLSPRRRSEKGQPCVQTQSQLAFIRCLLPACHPLFTSCRRHSARGVSDPPSHVADRETGVKRAGMARSGAPSWSVRAPAPESRSACPQTGALALTPSVSAWFPRTWQWHPNSGTRCFVPRHRPQTQVNPDEIATLGPSCGHPHFGICSLGQRGKAPPLSGGNAALVLVPRVILWSERG